jgi:hypothetical protein
MRQLNIIEGIQGVHCGDVFEGPDQPDGSLDKDAIVGFFYRAN